MNAYNYYLKVCNFNAAKNAKESILFEKPFDKETNNIFCVKLIFYTKKQGPYTQRFDWACESANLEKLTRKDTWRLIGELKFDKDSFSDKTDEELKALATRLTFALSKELLYKWNYKNKFNWNLSEKEQIKRISERIIENKALFYNFDFTDLCNRYVFNSFPWAKEDLKYISATKTIYKDIKENRPSIEVIREKKNCYAIIKISDLIIETPICDEQFAVLNNKKDFYKDLNHEWISLYNSSSIFDKTKLESMLRDRLKRHFFATIKNAYNFAKNNIVRYNFYLKKTNSQDNIESLENIGFVELDKNQFNDSQTSQILDLITFLVVKPLYNCLKNKTLLNKYDFIKFVSLQMDQVYFSFLKL